MDWVQGFRTNILSLRAPETTEAAVRQEYIDPFWVALGWDVANKAHRSGAERDVKVEAKKPAVDIDSDKNSISQAKTYAWSAQFACNKQYIEQLPIKLPQTAAERKLGDKITERVKRIIGLKEQLAEHQGTDHQRTVLERVVEADEKAIDELVCRLYGVDEIPE